MDDGTKGLLLLLVIGTIVSFIMHSINKQNYLITGIASSIMFCVIAQKIDPDTLIGVAFFVGAAICSGISLVVGLPFLSRRNNRDKSK